MIELTPKEVEACRRLKSYTEKQLATELYSAIEYPMDEQDKKFMKYVREMSQDALKYIKQITELLKNSQVRDKAGIEKMLREAGPLSVYYAIDDASSDLDKRDKSFKNIEKTRDEKINKYKKDIRTLEEAERKLNKNINTLLYKMGKNESEGKHFTACKLDASIKDIVSSETKEIIDSNTKLIDSLSGKPKDKLKRSMVIEGAEGKEGYFEVKKHLDLEIARLYNKIEWQKEYAEGLKRQATADNCLDKLEVGHIDKLIGNDKLSPSDCSDIFRLLGTMMEELDKMEKKDWEKLYEYYTKPDTNKEIDLDHLKFCIQLQGVLRETSGLDVKGLFPRMPPKLANKLIMPDEYQIDRGERFVKYCDECGKDNTENGAKDISTIAEHEELELWYECGNHPGVFTSRIKYGDYLKDNYPNSQNCKDTKCHGTMNLIYIKFLPLNVGYYRRGRKWECLLHGGNEEWLLTDKIAQELKCAECGKQTTLYFDPAKHAKEKTVEATCPSCGKKTKFDPIGGVKPFWKDEIRARWRDTWSSTFVLEYNSVVRAIDRTFGLPEGADISGTTADSIFGMEAVMALKGGGERSFGTDYKPKKLEDVKNKYWPENYSASSGYPGYVILLPLITMVKHGHHALLECALTFTLTGYIDAYHIGQYTSLWPKGSSRSGALWNIFKYWEDSPSNVRILIDRNEEGFVERGWLLEKDTVIGGYKFDEINKLNYQTYVNVFLELRNKMRDNEKINYEVILDLMLNSERELVDLEIKILKETAKRSKDWAEKNDKFENYNEFAEGLKEYSEKDLINVGFKNELAKLSGEYPVR